jgi:fructose-1,6-bisphosphatase I
MRLDDHIKCSDDLKEVILTVSRAARKICRGFAIRRGAAGSENVYGEEQQAMDKWADEVLISELGASGLIASLASEEQPEVLKFSSNSDLSVTVDPLDGSSLLDVNLAVGTIVGFYRGNVLSPGTMMVGAMYVLYGPLTTLTYCVGSGVHEFMMDVRGEFILQHEDLRIPEGKIYAPGALRKDWLPVHQKYVEALEADGYKLRYSGSFVADVHQILHKGGVFTYPAYRGREQGKLRLLFECAPMGYILTQSGGAVSDGVHDLLSISPESVSQRVPVYIGGRREIERIEGYNKE